MAAGTVQGASASLAPLLHLLDVYVQCTLKGESAMEFLRQPSMQVNVSIRQERTPAFNTVVTEAVHVLATSDPSPMLKVDDSCTSVLLYDVLLLRRKHHP